ncbi:GDP-mannose transporter [Galdieria sulphuraria]|nr:GDP-mannose transporter [Galdieria sulphuraria]
MNTQEESSHNNIISILPSGEEKPGSSSVFRQLGKSEAVLSCLCYGLSSMSVTLMNKLIFSGEGRQFPISCIVVQNAISTLFLALCTLLGLLSSSKLSLQLLRRLFVPQLFSSLYLYSNAKAFEYLTIPVIPIWRRCFHFGVFYSTQGYFWTGTRYSNIAKAMNGNLLSFIVLTPFAWIQKEPQQIYYDWSQLSSVFKASFTFSGVAVTVIQISVFWVNATTSGATFSFVGNFIKVPTIIIGTIFFHEKLPFMAWVGVIMGILSGFLFSLSKYLQVPILMRTSSSNFNLDSHSPGSSLTKTERSN